MELNSNLPLDLAYLREMSDNSIDFMIEILDAFKEQTPIYMESLEKAVLDSDWKSVSECAHKIKPTFFYIGHPVARDFMQEMESNARDLKNIGHIPINFEKIKNFVAELYQKIDETKLVLQAQIE
jgi:HPt (histidine-containing phosphotransfer) domain-containing protein